MATIISTKTSGVGGLSVTGDASGILQLASADGTTALTIDSSQRIGIGTASPVRFLSVMSPSADTQMTIGYVAPSITLTNAVTNPNTNTQTFVLAMATVAGNYGRPNSGDCLIGNVGSARGDIYIDPNYSGAGTKNLLLCSYTGNVGIGLSNPSAKLSIVGNIAQNATLSAWNDPITVFQQKVASFWNNGPTTVIGHNVLYGTSYAATRIDTGYSSTLGFNMDGAGSMDFTNYGTGAAGATLSSSIAMRITSSGKVGIGAATSPDVNLHVGAATPAQGILAHLTNTTGSTGTGAYLQFTSAGVADWAIGQPAGATGALSFRYGTNIGTAGTEYMRINSSGDVGIGTVSNAGNTLRYLDIQNTDTGASAGAIIRLITNNSASTAVTTADIVKYKNGLFSINNNDAGQIALNIAGSNRLYINSGESMILRSSVGSTAGYDSYHTNINGMSLAVNRFTSSNGDIGDWPTPVLAIKGYDSNFNGLTMQTFGSRDDNAGYQTASAVWNIRLWNDAGGTWTTSNSSTAMELKGPGPYRIQAGASNGVQLTNGATSWTAWSDENMKDIIEPITDALQKVSTLRTVIGKYKKEADGIRRPFLIAQDVEKVLPEAVTVSIERDEINPDDIYAELEQRERLLLSYTDVIPLLTASIKELKIIIDTQNARIEALEAK